MDLIGSTGESSTGNDLPKTGVHSSYRSDCRWNVPAFDTSWPIEVATISEKIGIIQILSFNILIMLYH